MKFVPLFNTTDSDLDSDFTERIKYWKSFRLVSFFSSVDLMCLFYDSNQVSNTAELVAERTQNVLKI